MSDRMYENHEGDRQTAQADSACRQRVTGEGGKEERKGIRTGGTMHQIHPFILLASCLKPREAHRQSHGCTALDSLKRKNWMCRKSQFAAHSPNSRPKRLASAQKYRETPLSQKVENKRRVELKI